MLTWGVSSWADEISLAKYIDRANTAGINIIYSSAVLPERHKVTFEPGTAPTIKGIRKALNAFGLDLQAVNETSWIVVANAPSPVAPEPPELDTDNGLPPIEEVVVSSSRYRLLVATPNQPHLFDAETLNLRAVTGNDAVRVANQLPGSATVGISARPRVRGGQENETLIQFDGIRLYNPFHFNRFNSLFSSFDSRLLASIDFYSGGFPVSMGDRLSAAMVVESRSNTELENQRELGVGLFHASYLQGFTREDSDLLVSLRRSNFELLDSIAENDFGHPIFADAFIRYRRELPSGADWTTSLLWFIDDIDVNDSSANEVSESIYGNLYWWTTHEQDTGARYQRSRLGYSRIKNDREGSLNRPGQVVGEINDKQTFHFYFLGQDYEWSEHSAVFNLGWDYRYLEADYETYNQRVVDPAFSQLSNIVRPDVAFAQIDESGHQGAVYAQWKQRLKAHLAVELGARIDAQHYESSIQDEQFTYRLGVLYEPLPNLKLRLSWGEYAQAQGVHELNVSDLEFQFQPPQQANHLVAGFDYEFSQTGINLRLEAYRKVSSDPHTYFENLAEPYTLLPELQPDRIQVAAQGYEARGLEVSLNGELLGGEWWLNFSAASARDRLPGKNIRRSWDQSRAINLGYHQKWRDWDLSGSIAFHEGWLTTPLMLTGGVVTAAARNSERFDHFMSLDVKAKRTWSLGEGSLRVELGVTNLLNRENQVAVDYGFEAGAFVATPKNGLPLAPFLDVYWAF